MQVDENIVRDIMRFFVWYPFRWLLRGIPVSLSFLLFQLAGNLHFFIGGKKRDKISSTIKTFLDSSEGTARDITKKYFRVHYIDRLHIFLYPKLTDLKRLREFVYFENVEVLDRVLRDGRGALIVQPHFGPVQITLLALALSGYDPVQIGYPSDKGLSKVGRSIAFRQRIKYEKMLPAPILSADGYLGKAYKHLKKGGVVLTTGDGAGGGVFIGEQKNFKFLSIERLFPLGPAAWATKTGAAFIPTFIIPEGYKRFRIVFENPIGDATNKKKNAVHLTEKFIALAESYIRAYPHCWHFWDEI